MTSPEEPTNNEQPQLPREGHVTPESQRYNPLTHPVKYVTEPIEDPLRPHIYDGIQEYDKRLPNWWLWTLYGTIIYSVIYWAFVHAYGLGTAPMDEVEMQLAENFRRAEQQGGVINDENLWELSRNASAVTAGKGTFDTTCAACHKPDLTGLIGPNLVDQEWIHGGKPLEAMKIITEGVLNKGMPAWGAVLGKQKITEVNAYIFSKHQPGEEIVPVTGWTMPGMPAPAPAP